MICIYLIVIPNTKLISSVAGLVIILAKRGKLKESVIFTFLLAPNIIFVNSKSEFPYTVLSQGEIPIPAFRFTLFTVKG